MVPSIYVSPGTLGGQLNAELDGDDESKDQELQLRHSRTLLCLAAECSAVKVAEIEAISAGLWPPR